MPLPTTYVYLDPQQAISLINATPANGWAIFQGYRFVTGTTPNWDCSSSDWHDHWTHLQEEYCWGDYLHILDSLRSGFTYIDPAGVGILQGRSFAPAPAQAARHRGASGAAGDGAPHWYPAPRAAPPRDRRPEGLRSRQAGVGAAP